MLITYLWTLICTININHVICKVLIEFSLGGFSQNWDYMNEYPVQCAVQLKVTLSAKNPQAPTRVKPAAKPCCMFLHVYAGVHHLVMLVFTTS